MIYEIDTKFKASVSILIVDDDKSYRDTVRTELEKEKYMVTDVENAKVASELLTKKKFHICLIDQIMENMKGDKTDEAGYELGAFIKDKQKYSYVIIVTGRTEFEPITRAISSQAINDYIEKHRVLTEDGFIGIRVLEAIKEREMLLRNWDGTKTYKIEPLDFIDQKCKVVNTISEQMGGVVELFGESWLAKSQKPGRMAGSAIRKGELARIMDIYDAGLLVGSVGFDY